MRRRARAHRPSASRSTSARPSRHARHSAHRGHARRRDHRRRRSRSATCTAASRRCRRRTPTAGHPRTPTASTTARRSSTTSATAWRSRSSSASRAPARAQHIRLIVAEFMRIADHLRLHRHEPRRHRRADELLVPLPAARGDLSACSKRCCGARLLPSYSRVGGLAIDVPAGLRREAARRRRHDRRSSSYDVEKLVEQNRIFLDRVVGVGVITRRGRDQLRLHRPVPARRPASPSTSASEPYLGYDRFDFDVPIGRGGDNYARFLVRMEEMRQSLRILRAGHRPRMPAGPGHRRRSARRAAAEDRGLQRDGVAHLPLQADHARHPVPPVGETYFQVEGGNGELGFYVVSDGTGRPWKCACARPASQPMLHHAPGVLLADVIPTFDFINMIGGEWIAGQSSTSNLPTRPSEFLHPHGDRS